MSRPACVRLLAYSARRRALSIFPAADTGSALAKSMLRGHLVGGDAVAAVLAVEFRLGLAARALPEHDHGVHLFSPGLHAARR